MAGPLSDIRVIDLTNGPVGGIATMILADFGADVIKVERPGGDPFRFLANAPMWLRGKRSVELDLHREVERDRLFTLVETADVVITSYRGHAAVDLGCDYDVLNYRNVGLVYCQISGFGPYGPYVGYPGYEGVVAAKAGRMAAFAGLPNREGPAFAAVNVASHGAALGSGTGHPRRAAGARPAGLRPVRRDEHAAGPVALRTRRALPPPAAAARPRGVPDRPAGGPVPHADAQLPPGADQGRALDPAGQPAPAPLRQLPHRDRPDRCLRRPASSWPTRALGRGVPRGVPRAHVRPHAREDRGRVDADLLRARQRRGAPVPVDARGAARPRHDREPARDRGRGSAWAAEDEGGHLRHRGSARLLRPGRAACSDEGARPAREAHGDTRRNRGRDPPPPASTRSRSWATAGSRGSLARARASRNRRSTA